MSIIIAMVIAAAMAIIFNRRFEDTVALAIFTITTILYFSGLVTTFIPGALVVYVLFVAGIIICISQVIKDWHRVLVAVLTPGFIGFIILSFYFFAVSYGRYFGCVDDFIHWGIAAKYCYLYSDFGPVSNTSDWVPYYPPMSTIWAYFSTKDWLTCSTGMMIWGQQMFIMSLLLPVFKLIDDKKNKLPFVPIIFGLMTLPYWVSVSETWEYTSLMPDLLLGALFFYIVWTYREFMISEDRFQIFLSLYGVFIITLVKQTGIIHALLAVFLVFIVNTKSEISMMRNTIRLVLYTISTLIAYASWNMYCVSNGMSINRLAQRIGFKSLFVALIMLVFIAFGLRKVLRGYYLGIRPFIYKVVFVLFVLAAIGAVVVNKYEYAKPNYYFNEFVEYFFDIDKAYMGYIVRIPIAFLVILVFVIVRKIIKDSPLDNIIWNAMIMTLAMYIIFRISGRIIITPGEYPLASLTRYLYSDMLSVILFGFCMVYKYLENERKDIILILTLLVMTNSSMVLTSIFDKPEKPSFPALNKVTFNINDKIYLVDVSEDRLELPFMYEAVPAYNDGSAYEDSWYRDGDLNGRRMTKDEVDRKLKESDINFVYLRRIDEGFAEYYSDLFEDVNDIGDERIYKVNRDDGQLCLELCN